MYKHLSDPDNYKQYDVTVLDIHFQDENYDSVPPEDADKAYLIVRFSSKEELTPFVGVEPDYLTYPWEEHKVGLQISQENHLILLENGFYDAVSPGDVITVTTSDWIYMDGNFFYVSAVTHSETQYLSIEEGLENIIDMMKKDLSLL